MYPRRPSSFGATYRTPSSVKGSTSAGAARLATVKHDRASIAKGMKMNRVIDGILTRIARVSLAFTSSFIILPSAFEYAGQRLAASPRLDRERRIHVAYENS